EDGIRDFHVTGVQTCALPIYRQLVLLEKAFAVNQLPLTTIDDLTRREAELEEIFYNFRARFEGAELSDNHLRERLAASDDSTERSEERRVGKEGRRSRSTHHE